MRRVITACLLASTLAAAFGVGIASAQTVIKYNRPRLYVYDLAGNPLREVHSKDLPTNVPVVAKGTGGTVGVRVNGEILYFDPMNVVVEGATGPCQAGSVVAARPATSGYAASSGPLDSGGGGCKLGK